MHVFAHVFAAVFPDVVVLIIVAVIIINCAHFYCGLHVCVCGWDDLYICTYAATTAAAAVLLWRLASNLSSAAETTVVMSGTTFNKETKNLWLTCFSVYF